MELDNPPAIIEQVQSRDSFVREQIEALTKVVSLSSLDLAELLSEAKRELYHIRWGFPNFDDYVVQAQLGIGKRQAAYLINIYNGAETLGIPREALEAAGISKLKLIFTLDMEQYGELIRDLVQRAPGMTVEQVSDEVKQLKEAGEDNFSWINAPVLREDKDGTYAEAISFTRTREGQTIDVKSQQGKDLSEGACIVVWAQNYMQDPNNEMSELGEMGDFEDAIELDEPHDAIEGVIDLGLPEKEQT
jgi:hypothetical protein